jgi:LacI family transcriptional regulator
MASSLRDLASTLGLSITTVSRALDGYADVSEATRARVRAAAESAAYRPNAAARRLRRGSTDIVTLILPTEPGHFDEPLYIQMLAPIGDCLARAGYDLTLIAATPGPDETKMYRRIVEERRADALIVVRTRHRDPRVQYLATQDFPFVVLGRTECAKPYAHVDGDGEVGFRLATERLCALGHRRITHLAAPSAFTFAGLRSRGYAAAMTAAGLAPDVVEDLASEEGGYRAARVALMATPRPTALLCATDRMAIGALRAARERKLDVPCDLSVVGHDNLPATAFTDPPLSTMELPIAETGTRLAEMVLARLGGADPRDLHHLRAVEMIDRASTAAPP